MLAQELICLKILQNLAVHCPSDARREGLDDWPVIGWTPPVFVTTFVNGEHSGVFLFIRDLPQADEPVEEGCKDTDNTPVGRLKFFQKVGRKFHRNEWTVCWVVTFELFLTLLPPWQVMG